MTGITVEDACPRCGGPLTQYADGSRRCKPCRSKERTAQKRRQRQRTDVAFDAIVAAQEPTPAEIELARELWRTGQAGDACRAAGLSSARLAALVGGCTRDTARRWMAGGSTPQTRWMTAAAAVLIALDVIPKTALDRPDLVPTGAIPYDDLSDIAKDCWHDFERFRARYLGSVSAPWQVDAAQRVLELRGQPGKTYAVINCPQGSGKTRLFTHDLAVWLTVRDRSMRGLIGSLGRALSESLTGNLRDTLAREVPVVARDIDRTRGMAADADATVHGDYGAFQGAQLWRRDKFYVAQHGGQPAMHKDPTWAAFSREARFLGWRVDVSIWDDLVSTDTLRNPEHVEDLYRWFDIEAESRTDNDGLMLVVGQRLGANDIYRRLLDKRIPVDEIDGSDEPETAQYHHIVYPAHYDQLCKGDDTHRRDMAPTTFVDGRATGSCLLDASRITPRDMAEKKAAGIYEVVYQQQDTDPTNVLVRKTWIEGGDEDGISHVGCWDKDRAAGTLPEHIPAGQHVRYMTVDPSPTRYWGIIDTLYVLPRDTERLAGTRYVLDIARRKMGANEFLDRAADGTYIGLAEEWVQRAKAQGHPISHLIMEKNAAQRWAMQYSFFRDWASSRGVQILEHETTRNKTDPTYGIWATLPAIYRYGRVRLPADTSSRARMFPLVAEVTTYPDGVTDDLVMSQWFGEYHLDNLIAAGHTGGRMYRAPSWMTSVGRTKISHAQARISELAAAQRALGRGVA